MYLKPKDDTVLLRDPDSRVALPSYGGNVPKNAFWIRRKRDRDALPTTAEEVAKGAAAAARAATVTTKSVVIDDTESAESVIEKLDKAKPTKNKKDR